MIEIFIAWAFYPYSESSFGTNIAAVTTGPSHNWDQADMNPFDIFSCNDDNVFFLTFINAWQKEHYVECVENRK